MKILFILGAYKPRASANGLCVTNVVEYLKSQGHSITVLSNKHIDGDGYENENGVEIYRVKQRLFFRIKEYIALNGNKRPLICKLLSGIATILNKIQLFFMSSFWPVVSPMTNRRFRNTAMTLQKKNNYDVVVSIYTPIEALLAGYEVKKSFTSVKFIPYFLDSMSGGYGPKFFSKRTIINRGLKIERKLYSLADSVFLMKSSEEHQLKYNGQYGYKMNFLDIPMLLSRSKNKSLNSNMPSSLCKMLFVGSISSKIRNPKTLIDALLQVESQNFVCEFIGNIDCIDDFSELKVHMGERLIFTGFMDHDKLEEKIAESDILLNIGNLIPNMVPSKIFEYMSYLKPIISTYDISNEPSATYLRQYPLALLLSKDTAPKENAEKIAQFIHEIHNAQLDYAMLEKQFYLNTPKAFADTLKKVMEE